MVMKTPAHLSAVPLCATPPTKNTTDSWRDCPLNPHAWCCSTPAAGVQQMCQPKQLATWNHICLLEAISASLCEFRIACFNHTHPKDSSSVLAGFMPSSHDHQQSCCLVEQFLAKHLITHSWQSKWEILSLEMLQPLPVDDGIFCF